ncbi:hypothetical protein GCM10022406_25950 [Hymenobacter algoricola]|uniref:Transposase n=1 Tax=Hymenobacter algoricola TaxID=486267 RepID=A0ABP7NAW2_9BACT
MVCNAKQGGSLTATPWAQLALPLPGQEWSPGKTAKDMFVEAVLWRARCGVSWGDLPTERFVLADRAYEAAYARNQIQQARATAVIPSKKNRLIPSPTIPKSAKSVTLLNKPLTA